MPEHKYTTTRERRDKWLRDVTSTEPGVAWQAEGNDIQAELAEARALAERLPLTANGVRVGVGDTVWWQGEEQIHSAPLYLDGYNPDDRDTGIYVWACYSTEAALAAAKEKSDE